MAAAVDSGKAVDFAKITIAEAFKTLKVCPCYSLCWYSTDIYVSLPSLSGCDTVE